jgi:hypothetical protein
MFISFILRTSDRRLQGSEGRKFCTAMRGLQYQFAIERLLRILARTPRHSVNIAVLIHKLGKVLALSHRLLVSLLLCPTVYVNRRKCVVAACIKGCRNQKEHVLHSGHQKYLSDAPSHDSERKASEALI